MWSQLDPTKAAVVHIELRIGKPPLQDRPGNATTRSGSGFGLKVSPTKCKLHISSLTIALHPEK